jgi:hypothetical protein
MRRRGGPHTAYHTCVGVQKPAGEAPWALARGPNVPVAVSQRRFRSPTFLCDNAQLLAGAESLYGAEDLAKGHVP